MFHRLLVQRHTPRFDPTLKPATAKSGSPPKILGEVFSMPYSIAVAGKEFTYWHKYQWPVQVYREDGEPYMEVRHAIILASCRRVRRAA